jgi:hypothetical protein
MQTTPSLLTVAEESDPGGNDDDDLHETESVSSYQPPTADVDGRSDRRDPRGGGGGGGGILRAGGRGGGDRDGRYISSSSRDSDIMDNMDEMDDLDNNGGAETRFLRYHFMLKTFI